MTDINTSTKNMPMCTDLINLVIDYVTISKKQVINNHKNMLNEITKSIEDYNTDIVRICDYDGVSLYPSAIY